VSLHTGRISLSAVCSGQYLEESAVELWSGCDFGCRYCLPVTRRWAKLYPVPAGEGIAQVRVQPRTCDPLNVAKLTALFGSQYGSLPPAFLCLRSDPYPAVEESLGFTRRAIALLHRYRIGVRVLTKSGTRAVRDFAARKGVPRGRLDKPLTVDPAALTFTDAGPAEGPAPELGSHPEDAFGATISFLDEEDSRRWEPRAAPAAERMAGLEEAHRRGIPTWANLMPVIDPEQTLECIRLTHAFVDLYSLGNLELVGRDLDIGADAAPFDWAEFATEAVALCKSYGVPAYARKDAGHNEQLAEVVSRMDRLMSETVWAEACRAAKPAWYHTGQGELEASLAEACLVQWGC
jgi:DNA repair photolyase